MLYFNHDTQASKDDRIIALRSSMGGAAVDAYWTIIELIHRDETELVLGESQMLTKSVSAWLFTDEKTLMQWVEYMLEVGLLVLCDRTNESVIVTSERARGNIAAYQQKAETARENGKNGGRKPSKNRVGSNSDSKTNQDRTVSKRKSKSKSNKEDIPNGISKKNSTFSPPSVDEVKAYASEKGYSIDAERFCDFYRSKGWMVGKNKMKDWRAAVRNWNRNSASKAVSSYGKYDR